MIFIKELVEMLPELLWVLVSGYLYIKVFNFISYTKNPKNYEYTFLKSVICGTIFTNVTDFFTNQLIFPLNKIILIILVVVSAFVFAKIFDSSVVGDIFKKLGVCRTFNNNIWLDIMDKKHSVWLDVRSRKLGRHYMGEIVMVEDFEKYPRIVLSRYTIYDKDNDVIEDYDKDLTKRIVIDTSLYDDIRLIYNQDSKNIKN